MSQVNVNQPPPPVEGPPVAPAPADGTGLGFIVGILLAIVIIALLVYFLLISPGGTTNSSNNTTGGNGGSQNTPGPGPSGARLVELA